MVCERCYLVARNKLKRFEGWRKLGGGFSKCHAEEAGGKGENYKCDERVEHQ